MPSDALGYRENVAMVVVNASGRLLWCERTDGEGWQFPQGGIEAGEQPEQAARRELFEETGLFSEDIRTVASTADWLYYSVPHPKRIKAQKQRWFLLELVNDEASVSFARSGLPWGGWPEFRGYRWVSFWYPLGDVVPFKREVYRKGLIELAGAYAQLVAEPS